MRKALITPMVKKADLTVGQKTHTEALHKEDKPQKVTAERAGCSQSAVSKGIHRKWTGRDLIFMCHNHH